MMLNVLNYLLKNFVLKKNNSYTRYNILERRYSKITSVNINNWNNIHKEIIDKINDCDFVSIDVEYTGLHLKDERYISIDSSYEAHCYGAKSFFPCQIGITIAKKNDIIEKINNPKENKITKKNLHNIKVINNIEEKNKGNDINNYQEWNISPYCIYVFPKENKYFSVSTTTLIFLKENNFDFNEWIFNGVSYLRPNEEEEKKKSVIEKINELKSLLNKCNTKTSNYEEKIDINKVINEIENNKIVDEEDKDAVIEIIKKIGIWLNSSSSLNIKNNCPNEIDKKNNIKIESINYKNMQDSGKSKDEKELSSNVRNTDIEINELKNYDPYNINENCTSSYDKSLEENFAYKNIMSNKINKDDKNNGNNSNNDDNSSFCYNQDIINYDKENDKFDEDKTNDISNYPLYIEVENPYLRLLAHTLITKYFNSIFCISIKVNDKKHLAIYRTEKDSYKEQIKAFELEIEKINKIIGVRLLFDEIIKNRKIIIGHNCFYDILHIYQTFYHDLPKSINEFKKKWTQLFPYTFDTKFINETNEYLYALNGPATLKGLCEYMASLISSSNDFDFFFNFMNDYFDLPKCFVPFINVKNKVIFNQKINSNNNLIEEEYVKEKKKSNDENNNEEYVSIEEKYNNNYSNRNTCSFINNSDERNILSSDEHNAGYDSLLTCLLFIFQCHYILKKNNIMWKDIYFYKKNKINENLKCFFDIFLSMSNKIKIVKTQPNVVSLTSTENYEMARHFYMYDYPSYFKKWEIMKIWSPIWITLSKVDDQSCWIIAKSDDDAKNIKMIYKMLKNPQFKLCTYEEYLNKFKSK
ncbi:poly(A)-specific ribonuclease PARN, putative [Plasmodium gallinaceum]|uniref:Poly(A)-specific ribonuclease PARN, putative n=1 Tax=Plasmodium gallinaceum TaxID=5849 RepID=A0A1J1GTK3_PLAGA|nr:poly(A)-specific ribonuclease PARN, putative [Plasmodium gallinaceum]CRG94630.1 poly(A)-specific ribonuclease PARN, putative [Plasmodium gallinaceum]